MAALRKLDETERPVELKFLTVKDRNAAIDLIFADQRLRGVIWQLVDGMTISIPESREVVFRERKLRYTVK